MDNWRRQAIEMFPEHQDLLADVDETFSPYALWFEFLELVRAAHREGDDDFLRRAYAYADWSRIQQEKDVWTRSVSPSTSTFSTRSGCASTPSLT